MINPDFIFFIYLAFAEKLLTELLRTTRRHFKLSKFLNAKMFVKTNYTFNQL